MEKIFNGQYELSTEEKIVQNEVRIEHIIQDENFNPRSNVDPKVVTTLMTVSHIPAIKLAYFPEISDKLIIVDGNHRYTSRVNNGSETIRAIIYQFDDELKLFKEATISNLNHGVMLSKEDRISALAKLIVSLDTAGEFSAAGLAKELGGLDAREMRKIFAWSKVVEIIGSEELGYNISKGDVLYRLITKGKKTEEEFKEIYEKFKDLKFSDLQEAVKRTVNGEEIDTTDITIEKIQEESDMIDSVMSMLDEDDFEGDDEMEFLEDSDEEGTELEYQEEFDDIHTKDEVEYITRELDFKLYSIEQRINNGCKINRHQDLSKELVVLKTKIEKLEQLLGE